MKHQSTFGAVLLFFLPLGFVYNLLPAAVMAVAAFALYLCRGTYRTTIIHLLMAWVAIVQCFAVGTLGHLIFDSNWNTFIAAISIQLLFIGAQYFLYSRLQ